MPFDNLNTNKRIEDPEARQAADIVRKGDLKRRRGRKTSVSVGQYKTVMRILFISAFIGFICYMIFLAYLGIQSFIGGA